jgi:hypothetical protein
VRPRSRVYGSRQSAIPARRGRSFRICKLVALDFQYTPSFPDSLHPPLPPPPSLIPPSLHPPRSLYQRLRHAAFALFARAHAGLAPAAAAAAWATLPEARRDAFRDRALAALVAHQARAAPPPRPDAPGVKRPKSAFLCFLAEFRAERKRRGAAAGALQKDICSAAGAAWRALSAAERAPFEAQSRASKDAWARSRGGARGGPTGGSAPPMAPSVPPHPLWAAAAAPLPQLRLPPLPAAPPPPPDVRGLRLAPELLQLLEGPLFPPEAGAPGADPGLATSWIPPLG